MEQNICQKFSSILQNLKNLELEKIDFKTSKKVLAKCFSV